MHLTDFLKDETGAVTVDWTVLTAATVGLGIAAYGVVSGGVADLSGDTARNLGRPFIRTAFLTPETFSNGPGNWIGTGTRFVEGFGDVLGPIAGNAAGSEKFWQDFEIPGGAMEVEFGFDLLSIDSIDGGLVDHGWGAEEGPVLYLNGQEIARARSQGGTLTWTHSEVPGVRVVSTETRAGENIGGMSPNQTSWHDGINAVRVEFDEPTENVRIGFGMKGNQGVTDESIAIDNFTFQAI
jgi:Flp pilus assembly pilin Flp